MFWVDGKLACPYCKKVFIKGDTLWNCDTKYPTCETCAKQKGKLIFPGALMYNNQTPISKKRILETDPQAVCEGKNWS